MEHSFNYIKHAKPEIVLEEMIDGPLTSTLEDLINKLRKKGLPDEVVNVILRFSILVKDMQVDVIFIENIATMWSEQSIKTANHAVDDALYKLKTNILREPEEKDICNLDSSDTIKLCTLRQFAQKSKVTNEDIGQLFRDLFNKDMR